MGAVALGEFDSSCSHAVTAYLATHLSTSSCVFMCASRTCLHEKQGTALSFIIVITAIMTSVGDEVYSTSLRKPETVTAGFGTASQE